MAAGPRDEDKPGITRRCAPILQEAESASGGLPVPPGAIARESGRDPTVECRLHPIGGRLQRPGLLSDPRARILRAPPHDQTDGHHSVHIRGPDNGAPERASGFAPRTRGRTSPIDGSTEEPRIPRVCTHQEMKSPGFMVVQRGRKRPRKQGQNHETRAGRKPGPVPDREARDRHLSRPSVTERLQRPTRECERGGQPLLPYSVLLRVGFAELPALPPALVSSYLTVSPLPRRRPGAVCFLWHFPWDCSRRELPGTLPNGARTFLEDPPASYRDETRGTLATIAPAPVS